MKITKNTVPLDRGVDVIHVLHSKRFDMAGFIEKAKKQGKKITIYEANGDVIEIN